MEVVYKKVETINEFIDAIRIRVEVFIIEQKCKPGWEPDELDKEAKHFIAIVNNQIVSTLRVRNTKPEEVKIESMATKKEYRGKGISKGLLEFVLNEIKKQNPKRIWMEAQVQAKDFYEKMGFKSISISEEYDLFDTGIPHIEMEYSKD